MIRIIRSAHLLQYYVNEMTDEVEGNLIPTTPRMYPHTEHRII